MSLNLLGGSSIVAKARTLGALLLLALMGGAATYGANVYYEYDDLGRLKSVSYDDGKQIDYDLDAAGNRKSVKTWNAPPVPVISDVLSWSTNGNFTVSWTAPTTTVAITRYELYEAANGGSFSSTALVNTLVTSYSATGRAEGRYYYRVRACNTEGCGRFATWTNSFNVDMTAPSPLTGLTLTAVAQTTAAFSWNVSTDNFELQDYQYRLQPSTTWISAGTALSANLTGLSAQTDYVFEARARDRAGNATALASQAFSTLRTIPTAPSNLAMNQIADCAWRAQWSASPGAATYTVRDTQGTETSTSNLEFIVNCPVGQPSSNQPYWVKACNANGCSARSFFGAANDTTPPTQPGALVFSNVLNNGATVTWAASTDNVLLDSYDYRLNGGAWINVAGNQAVITGLAVSTTYNMDVRAMDGVGNYSAIRSGSFTTLAAADTTPPNPPPSASVSNIAAYSVTVNWTAATDDIGVTGYRFKPTILSTWTTVGNVLTGTQFNLQASTNYTIEVQARDATGNWSTSRNTAAFTTAIGIPPTPTGLAMNQVADCAWNASWQASATATSYTVTDTNGGTQSTSNLSATVNCPAGNPQGNKPKYVQACNGSGCSAQADFSQTSSDTTAPGQPGTVTFSAITSTTATATWGAATDNVGVTSYEYSLNGGGYINLGLTTSVNLTGLTGATNYSFNVRARDAAGNAGAARSATLTTSDTTAPSQPGTVTFTLVTGTTATASWVASTDNLGVTGYDWRLNAGTWNSLGNVTTVNLTGLTGSTSYTFEVRARDASGNLSTSRTATLTTADNSAPTQPGVVTISLVTATTARANWVASTDNIAVTAYDYRLNGGTWVALGNVTQVDMTGLTQLTSYTFDVRARDAAGNTSTLRTASPFTTLDGSGPTQPGAVTISAITGSSATATWGASTDNVAVVGYDYQLNGGSWTNAGNVTTIGLTGLSQATNYTFAVRARDNAGNVSITQTAPVFATLDVTAPSQPTGVAASLVTATTARITWTASTDNVAVAAYDYRLNGGSWVNAGNVTLVDLTGLAQVTTYTVDVRARDAAGNASANGTASPFTTLDGTAPSQPGAVTISAITGSSATATWGASTDNVAVVGYDYQLNGGSWTNAGNVTTIGLTGLSQATNYTFAVRARDNAGNVSSTQTAPVFATLDVSAPSTPGAITVTPSAFAASFSWGASTDNVGIFGYDFRLTTSASWTNAGTGTGTTIGSLLPQTTYTFEVRARDLAGNLSGVQSTTFTTLVAPPNAPTNLAYNQVADCAWTASWSAVSGATSYTLHDTQGTDYTGITTTSKSINCPIGNPEGNKPSWVKACNSGGCSTQSSFSATGGDQLAPTQPGTISATNVQPYSATVSWGGSTDNVGVTGYYYRLDSGSWTLKNNTPTVGLTGLIDNHAYTFEVYAIDAAGNSSTSRTGGFSTPLGADVTPPSAPGSVTVSGSTSTSVSFSWTPASDNIGVNQYDYRVTASPTWTTVAASVSTGSISGLAPNTTYIVEVRARDAAGNTGNATQSASFTTPAGPPGVPTGVNKNQVADCAWRAQWYAPSSGGATTYYEWRQTNGTQLTINVDASTSYPIERYANCQAGDPNSNKPDWVRACNSAGCSSKVTFP